MLNAENGDTWQRHLYNIFSFDRMFIKLVDDLGKKKKNHGL